MAMKVCSVFRPNLFKGRVAIVTGGGTGIGKAIAQELLHLGCKVMIASRKNERLSQSADIMRTEIAPSNTAELEHMQCNIRKSEQVANLISTTLSRFGKLDFLINNGGGQFMSPAALIQRKGWDAVIETNLTGTFQCCREAYTQWMGAHGGVIINIIADMWNGFPGMTHTGAARSAVDNLTKTLSIEWASSGVRINSIAPGTIYSETAAANYENSSEMFNTMLSITPAKRFGKVEEVSAAVSFLLSPAAAFITGETIRVDGGSSLYGRVWSIPDHKKLPAYTWEDDDDGSGTKSKL